MNVRAVGLLALLAAMHYSYMLAAPGDAAQWFNAAGAITRAALLLALARRWRGVVLWVVAWWLAEEAMVAGCSVAYIVKPWAVLAGQDQCSALLHFDIAKLGAMVLALLLAISIKRSDE